MEQPDWVSDPLELEKPSAARMYDYYLGGAHNFAADRQMAAQILKLLPDTPLVAQVNRAFLHRAVRYMLGQGIRQFLDIGSGIPTGGNVHEVVQATDPDAKVVYVDIDPVAVASSEALLAGDLNTAVVQADLRDPERVLTSPGVRRLLDPAKPTGLLLNAVLPFVTDEDDPVAVIATLRDALAPGSYLGLSHGAPGNEGRDRALEAVYRDTLNPVTLRSRPAVEALLGGWDLVEPGLVWAPQWHPDWPDDVGEDPSWCRLLAAVGHKPT